MKEEHALAWVSRALAGQVNNNIGTPVRAPSQHDILLNQAKSIVGRVPLTSAVLFFYRCTSVGSSLKYLPVTSPL